MYCCANAWYVAKACANKVKAHIRIIPQAPKTRLRNVCLIADWKCTVVVLSVERLSTLKALTQPTTGPLRDGPG